VGSLTLVLLEWENGAKGSDVRCNLHYSPRIGGISLLPISQQLGSEPLCSRALAWKRVNGGGAPDSLRFRLASHSQFGSQPKAIFSFDLPCS
jgi:hypothetical protein